MLVVNKQHFVFYNCTFAEPNIESHTIDTDRLAIQDTYQNTL